MPEEINRLVTDALADLLMTPSEDANENLRREGTKESRIEFVGNIMIDSLLENLSKARKSTVLRRHHLERGRFVYVTLHRPSNVDTRESLSAILGELDRISRELPVFFPMHPRTRSMLNKFGITVRSHKAFHIREPVGYHDSLCLTEHARLVLTDSGGLQEESTYFRTPCLTLRPHTERPVTITTGSNRLTDIARLQSNVADVLAQADRLGRIPPFWDGRTAERVLLTLSKRSV
jgi:UDP-N-acetylglucosamine 2-epimerase (non-hydrolysing)